jgi:hypothetical protein
MNRENAPKKFWIYPWRKEIEEGGGGENTLRREKPVRESETLVLGELNPPKNSKIPRRNHKIITKGS